VNSYRTICTILILASGATTAWSLHRLVGLRTSGASRDSARAEKLVESPSAVRNAPREIAELVRHRRMLEERLAHLRTASTSTASPEPAPPPRAETYPWEDVGRDTPENAFESLLAHAAAGDSSALADALAFDVGAQREAEAFFASMPADLREAYHTPAALVAAVMCGKIPGDIVDWEPVHTSTDLDGETTLRVKLLQARLPPRETSFRLVLEQGEHRLLVPAPVIEGYRYAVTGVSRDHAPAPANP
jgi:hypothetical protein